MASNLCVACEFVEEVAILLPSGSGGNNRVNAC
jgi:hypothetical protein